MMTKKKKKKKKKNKKIKKKISLTILNWIVRFGSISNTERTVWIPSLTCAAFGWWKPHLIAISASVSATIGKFTSVCVSFFCGIKRKRTYACQIDCKNKSFKKRFVCRKSVPEKMRESIYLRVARQKNKNHSRLHDVHLVFH